MEVLLKRNKIEFAYADASQKRRVLTIRRRNRKITIEANDLIVKVDQPKAVLTQILFEPNQVLNDSLSYDITAWALPLLMELKVMPKKHYCNQNESEYRSSCTNNSKVFMVLYSME
jgi:hypothetical protein